MTDQIVTANPFYADAEIQVVFDKHTANLNPILRLAFFLIERNQALAGLATAIARDDPNIVNAVEANLTGCIGAVCSSTGIKPMELAELVVKYVKEVNELVTARVIAERNKALQEAFLDGSKPTLH